MEREYRHLWNEAGEIKGERYSEETSNYYNNTILLKKGMLKAENKVEKDKLYFTFELKESLFCHEELKEILHKHLKNALGQLLQKNSYKKGDKVLVVGLGNEKMTADSLGAIAVSGLQITRNIIEANPLKIWKKMANISAIKSSVSGVTGLQSFDIIKGVVEKTKPDFVIAVDTLACKAIKRLGRAVQLSDEGIEPGGGVNNPKTKLSYESLGIPVVAIGVPLVIYIKHIIREYLHANNAKIKPDNNLHSLVVTAKEIDITVEDYGFLISRVINEALNHI